ncbi:hypothetical protein AHAS_Ahas12G0165600 [Arachis hypogaea]
MMPTPGVPRSCTQQANEPSNTASHGVQSDPAIVAPSRLGSCQGTSAATSHSSTSAPKLRYDGAKCWHPPKSGLKRISQADDDTRKIWWIEWKVNFNYYITVIIRLNF